MILKTSYPFMKPPLSARLIRGHRLAQGLVGCWPFSANGGLQVFDLSGNGNNGTIDATGLWTPGKFGLCVAFDGADTNISFGNAVSNIIGSPTSDFTLSVYVNVSGFPEGNKGAIICLFNEQVLMFWWTRTGEGEFFECIVDYATSDASTKGSDIGDVAATGTWLNVVVVHKVSTKTSSIYVNGIEETYIDQTAGVGARVDRTGQPLNIGNRADSGNTFNGLIDMPMIYNRALTASEIAQLYREPFCMFERKARTALLIPSAVAIPGWIGINSSYLDSDCGDDGPPQTIENALDGINWWTHSVDEVHGFVVDLGQTYNVQKVRGRSLFPDDPLDVNIFVSDNKEVWGAAVVEGINTWKDTGEWQEVNTSPKNGRYVKVEIEDTEDVDRHLKFGYSTPFTIFDVYIDEEAPAVGIPIFRRRREAC